MTESQKLQKQLGDKRKELRAAALDPETTDERLGELNGEVSTLEARAAAIEATEPEPDKPQPKTETRETEDSETREFRALEEKVEVRRYLSAAMDGGVVDGAEREFNQALKMDAGSFPLRLLAPEVRATTDADAKATQGTWLDRIFAETAAAHIGVSFRSVAPGVASYPVTTAGASAAQRGRAEAAAAAAWTVGVTEIRPSRNAVKAVFTVEDAARMMGLEDALRRDLRIALVEGIDRAVFVGDAGANEAAGDITGLQTHANVSEITLSQTNKLLGPQTLGTFSDLIDGQYAGSLEDLRIVASVGTVRLWTKTIPFTQVDDLTLGQFLARSGLRWRARLGIDTNTADGDFGAFVGLGRGIEGAAIAAVWDAARLVRDPYSGADSGEIALNLTTLWGFALPRPAAIKRIKYVA